MTIHDGITVVNQCIFCGIASGSLPASIVYADDTVMAILDIFPLNPGHILIIPKRHAENLLELPQESTAAVMHLTQRVGAALADFDGLRCEGFNLFMANGMAAGQEVFHAHLHLIPRFESDGIRFGRSGKRPDMASRQELVRMSAILAERVSHRKVG